LTSRVVLQILLESNDLENQGFEFGTYPIYLVIAGEVVLPDHYRHLVLELSVDFKASSATAVLIAVDSKKLWNLVEIETVDSPFNAP
jgi:hypothetical protein